MIHTLKNWFERKIYGVGNKDLYNLDEFLSPIILNALKRFRDSDRNGYPCNLNSMEEWNSILDKMIVGFRLGLTTVAEDKEQLEGRQLFAEYFGSLWD